MLDSHGFSVPNGISDAIAAMLFGAGDPDRSTETINGCSTLLSGVPLGNGAEFRGAAPAVTGGNIAPIPVPAPLLMMAADLARLGAVVVTAGPDVT